MKFAKTIALIVSLLFSNVVFADPLIDIGKEIGIATKADGKLNLGVHFAYDAGDGSRFGIHWGILFISTLMRADVAGLPPDLTWNVYDSVTNTYLVPWSKDRMIKTMDLFSGTVDASDELAKLLIGNQGSVSIVFAKDIAHPRFHLPVGKLCRLEPDYFVDLTANKRCDKTTVEEITSAQEGFCGEVRTEYLDYVKQGLISCPVATKIFGNKGCGDLGCK